MILPLFLSSIYFILKIIYPLGGIVQVKQKDHLARWSFCSGYCSQQVCNNEIDIFLVFDPFGSFDTKLDCWPLRSRNFTHQAPQGFFDYFYSIISTLLGITEIVRD